MEPARDIDSWPAPRTPVLAMVEPGSTVLDDRARLAMLDSLPVAVMVIDSQANVRFVNERTAEMIGTDRSEIFGRNVLDFVLVDDIDFAAELLGAADGFSEGTMGPSRIRYVDAGGDVHWTQVWATSTPRELGIDGYILTLTKESVRDVLATAVTSVAADDEIDRTLTAIALSARAMPLCGHGAILVAPLMADDSMGVRRIGAWPLDDAAVNSSVTPWHRALLENVDADVDQVATDVTLDPSVRDGLAGAGVNALFVRVIRDLTGGVNGVFLVFRTEIGPASMNQNDHLDDAVRLASHAFAQANRHRELQSAALSDALTGVANRAAFIERLDDERRVVDVLFVDLDHFKSVNDTFGHQVGDVVVAAAADRIASIVRRDDVVYRTGGDEFVVVCEAMADDGERSAMAARLVEGLMVPFDVGAHHVRIGATVGIACGRNRTLRDTVRAADAALYEAKALGRAGWAHAFPAVSPGAG